MTWADVWRTVVTATIGNVVGVAVSLYVRHVVKLNRDELLRILAGVDGVVIINRKAPMLPLDQYRKALGVGAGVLLTGLLTWAESADLEPVLGPLVPEPFRPLVGVGLGAIAVMAGVIVPRNAAKPGPVRSAGTIVVPAPSTSSDDSLPSTSSTGTASVAAAVAPAPSTSDTAAATVDAAPFWAGVPAGAPTSPTSIVQLPPAPERSYQ